ncbi:MAG: hydroxyacylglutathione hydrolase, partial [Deltaproteobacteria bacterium]|nr:hydroxyacylglutathione hydrolase [Deltaproteobacteria bacterium]
MKVIPLPCLQDNFSYLIVCETSGEAGIVDPTEIAPVMAEVKRQGVRLTAILNTHHHWDHVQGNLDLIAIHPELQVFGHRSEHTRIPGLNRPLDHGEVFALGALQVNVLYTPGHTLGAVSYAVEDALFTGDTLFGAGCGRLFEGTARMMHTSLTEVIGALPRHTRLYFGHEYTENNLNFALLMEPHNQELLARREAVREVRARGGVTTPSTLDLEWRTNPFMRVDNPALIEAVQKKVPGTSSLPIPVFTV